MDDAELKALMRRNELENRQRRRRELRQRIENEANLLYEELDAEAVAATNTAILNMAKQEDQLREQVERAQYGYWTRLWRALFNKTAR